MESHKALKEENHLDLHATLFPALHHIGSSFMRVYYKNTYKYSILIETCNENGFEYMEYYADQDGPSYFAASRDPAYRDHSYKIPKSNVANVSKRILELGDDGYRLVYAREMNTKIIIELMERNIVLDRIKVCSLLEAFEITKSDGRYFIPGSNPLGIEWSVNGEYVFKTCNLLEKLNLGFQQIKVSLDDGDGKLKSEIDMQGDRGGCGGDGFTRALIKCLGSKEALAFKDVVIDLHKQNINYDYLFEAIVSGKISAETRFSHIISAWFYDELAKFKFYRGFLTVYLCLKQPENNGLFNSDIMQNIVNESISLLVEKNMVSDLSFGKMHKFFKWHQKPLGIECEFNSEDQKVVASNLSERVAVNKC